MREIISRNRGFWKLFLIVSALTAGISLLHRTTSTDNPSLAYCVANPAHFSGREIWIPDCAVRVEGNSVFVSTGSARCRAVNYPLEQMGIVERAQVRAIFLFEKEPCLKVLQVQVISGTGSRRALEILSIVAVLAVLLLFIKDFKVEFSFSRERNG